jgi:hypothetical protein
MIKIGRIVKQQLKNTNKTYKHYYKKLLKKKTILKKIKQKQLCFIKKMLSELEFFTKKKIENVISKLSWSKQYVEYMLAKYIFLTPRFLSFQIRGIISKYGGILFTTIYFATVILSIEILGNIIDLSIEIELARNFFIGAAAMVGGTLAIVASFAQFTIQQAAEQLPKDFYRLATNLNKYLSIIITDILITLVLFCGALTYGKTYIGYSAFSIQVGLLLIALSFYLILLLLNQVRADVDKDKILIKTVNSLTIFVREVRSRTVKFAKAQLLHPSSRGKHTLEQMLITLYQSPYVLQQFEYLQRELDYLFDYHDSFIKSSQKRAALEVLEGIKEVVRTYLNSRKESSLAFPEENSIMLLTSDSRHVLQPILERSTSLIEDYMRAEDTAGIVASVNVFKAWARQAAIIKYSGLRGVDNPILEQITGNFDQLMTRSMKHNSLEGMYQGIKFYNTVLILAIEKSLIHIFSSSIKKVEELGYRGMLTKQDPIISIAFTTYSNVLESIFKLHPLLFDHFFKTMNDHLNNLVQYGYTYTNAGGLRNNMTAQQDVAKPHKKLMELIYRSMAKVSEVHQIEKKHKWQRLFLDLTDNLRKSLSLLSEDMKNPNHMLIHSFGQIINNVGLLQIQLANDSQWNMNKPALLSQAKSYLHLSTWFLHDINKFESNLSFDSLIEAITNIGMASLQHEDMNDISKDSIDILTSKAIEFLDKEKTRGAMFLESEIMEHACYIGIIAQKNKRTQLVQYLKTKIIEFEKKYIQKYFSNLPSGLDPNTVNPPADKLKQSIKRLYRERDYGWTTSYGMGLMEDSRDEILSSTTPEDIKAFVSEVWGATEVE